MKWDKAGRFAGSAMLAFACGHLGRGATLLRGIRRWSLQPGGPAPRAVMAALRPERLFAIAGHAVPRAGASGPPRAAVTPSTREVTYLVLADHAAPYLLARVRWPDVAQAITVGSPDWLDDPGLFDLPYEPSAVAVSFTQAASVAAGWGRQLHAEPAEGVPSFMRRMPANWSDLSPVERRAYGLESVGRRRVSARRLRRLRSSRDEDRCLRAAANRHVGAHRGRPQQRGRR